VSQASSPARNRVVPKRKWLLVRRLVRVRRAPIDELLLFACFV
jgi:hypothetical protein